MLNFVTFCKILFEHLISFPHLHYGANLASRIRILWVLWKEGQEGGADSSGLNSLGKGKDLQCPKEHYNQWYRQPMALCLGCCCAVAKSCWFFVTPWTATRQASLSVTISWSLPKFMSVESVISTISSSGPLFSCFQSNSALGSFPMDWLFTSGGQSTGTSASALVLPMSIQGWFPLGWTGWISLQS